jgi:GGDEF domain-containing protein
MTDVEAAFSAGADDYITKPFRSRDLLARAGALLKRAHELRGLSPLTSLPGNFVILSELAKLIEANRSFALVYADVDNFKAYNDRYGFLRGDDAILMTSQILTAALEHVEGEPRLVGHVGGDDFVMLVPESVVENVASEVVRRFDAAIPMLFDGIDLERGGLATAKRDGSTLLSPLMTISLGNAAAAVRHFASSHEVVATATEVKSLAKQQRGSCWRIDRRVLGEPADASVP